MANGSINSDPKQQARLASDLNTRLVTLAAVSRTAEEWAAEASNVLTLLACLQYSFEQIDGRAGGHRDELQRRAHLLKKEMEYLQHLVELKPGDTAYATRIDTCNAEVARLAQLRERVERLRVAVGVGQDIYRAATDGRID